MSALFHHRAHRNVSMVLVVLAASVTLAGCGSLGGIGSLVTPYRNDVVQGNFVSKEQVEALRPGITRQQARDILGTPLLTSVFHADRWDYVFTFRRQNIEPKQYKLALFFKGEILDRLEGDSMPSEAEFVSSLDSGRKKTGVVPVLEASEESLARFPVAAPAGAQPPAPAGDKSYPPLEPPVR